MSIDRTNQREWSDHLNPILIKDLRQGMRSNLFVVWFIVSQIGLVAVTLLALAKPDDGSLEGEGDLDPLQYLDEILFWLVVSAALVFAPMRALFSLGRERKQHTLETILLAKGRARGLAFGTWCSYMAQNAHFCCSVGPYLLVRYLLGGQEIFQEMANLASILVISGSLTSTAIALSAAPSVGRKVVVLLMLGAINAWLMFPSSFLLLLFGVLPWPFAFLAFNLGTIPLIILIMLGLAWDSVQRNR